MYAAFAPPGHGALLAGTITKSDARFGYLAQDNGDVDLFVLPGDCAAFGGTIPAAGTRVLYVVGVDPQKGRPKADAVQPEVGGLPPGVWHVDPSGKGKGKGPPRPSHAPVAHGEVMLTGTISRGEGPYGYLQQDSGEPDLFVLPGDCEGCGGVIPARGTRVVYSIGRDAQKNKPKAVQVSPEPHGAASSCGYGKASSKGKGKGNGFMNGRSSESYPNQAHYASRAAPATAGLASGVITKSAGKFGYLKQDSGEQDLFVLPADCAAFGGSIPPEGTQVLYTVGVDPQKGKPKAEQIQPAEQFAHYSRPSSVRSMPY